MTKLLYLSNLRLPTEKAYGIQIAEMCLAFASMGLDVLLAYPYRKNPNKDFFSYYGIKRNFKIIIIPAVDFYLSGSLDKFSVAVKSFISALFLAFYGFFSDADFIYSRDEWPIYFLSFFKSNLIFEAHRFSLKRKSFYHRFKKKSVKMVVVSEAIKNDFVKIGFELASILVAHDGVDIDLFDIDITKEEARSKTNLPKDQKIIMYTGHLFEWKGADVLLEAARNFEKKDSVLFVFVGGTEYDLKQFRKKAEGLNNVLILGHKPHKEIPLFLKAADVLILPNSASDKISSYTSPLKLFEYMASGRPIVASGLPSIREVLNENNSILVKPDDPEALAEGIRSVLANTELAERIPIQALKDVQNYTWEKRAKKIIEFLCLQN